MINPAIKESSVDFPQPEGPAIEVKLPGRTEKEISFNAGVSRRAYGMNKIHGQGLKLDS